MAITKLDEVLEAIQSGKTNDEIRDEIDGRLSDKRLDRLREHPNVRWGESVSSESVKAEIERGVETIFAPGTSVEVTEKPFEISATVAAAGHKSVIEQTGLCDLRTKEQKTDRPAEKHEMRLKQTGAEYKGLLGYYVDGRAVTFWADGKEIDGDQLDELIEEIKEVVRIHRHFAEKG